MEIVRLPFEKRLLIEINGEFVHLVVFKTFYPGKIKFGIDAPLSVNVHKKEIFDAIKQRQLDKEDSK